MYTSQRVEFVGLVSLRRQANSIGTLCLHLPASIPAASRERGSTPVVLTGVACAISPASCCDPKDSEKKSKAKEYKTKQKTNKQNKTQSKKQSTFKSDHLSFSVCTTSRVSGQYGSSRKGIFALLKNIVCC